ncbi:MAG TPA: GDSL-type esterase/lipase family protein [Sandaracinaceae bacterium LLY-WYZ-13_1]|nr:GDSL-type esterase/lipase family protein [Sandaracinaceae bacterium LLY-WYZ-13_1]
MAVWGASHTACDHFTGRIRERLQARYGDGGRGFTFPAWPNPRSYWQSGVRVDRGEGWARLRLGRDRSVPDHYGVAGIVFDSAGRAATGRVRTGRWGVGAAASRFDVLTQAQPGGGVLEVLVDGERRATIDTAAPAVGALRHRIDVPEGPHGLELRARPGAPVRVYGVDVRRGHAGVVVHDLGLSGSRARYHLKWRDPVHTQQLTRLAPDLLVFAYGGNEGNDFAVPLRVFAGRFERALRRARRAAPEASCLVLGAFDKPLRRGGRWVHRHRTTGLAAVQRRIAARQGCAFFDTVAFMGGRLSMLRWVEADLAREDHVHLNARGYDRLGDVLVNALVPR